MAKKKRKSTASVRAKTNPTRKKIKKAVPKKKSSAARRASRPKRKLIRATSRDVGLKLASLVPFQIDDLNLSPDAKAASESLQQQFGSKIAFLSGRRDIAGQAAAMAPHIVKDRQWITETYQDPKMLLSCKNGWTIRSTQAAILASQWGCFRFTASTQSRWGPHARRHQSPTSFQQTVDQRRRRHRMACTDRMTDRVR
jgi:hypothetical protein